MSLRAEHSVVVLTAIAARSAMLRKMRFNSKGKSKGHPLKGHKNTKEE
jgi:hypothetical protein